MNMPEIFFRSFASSSKGNCYFLQEGERSILIDPGINIKSIRRNLADLKWDLSKIDCVLLTHEHKDHSAAIKDILKLGKLCFMSACTIDALGVMNSNALIAENDAVIELSGWKITPFDVIHDTKEPIGFEIESPLGKRIVFATDTYYVGKQFDNINIWMIEANYSEFLLKNNDELTDDVKNRIRATHFSLANVLNFFLDQNLNSTVKIYLLHLSDDNSNAEQFADDVRFLTGLEVIVC